MTYIGTQLVKAVEIFRIKEAFGSCDQRCESCGDSLSWEDQK